MATATALCFTKAKRINESGYVYTVDRRNCPCKWTVLNRSS